MNATIEEQGMLKILEHLATLLANKKRMKFDDVQERTGIEKKHWNKLTVGGIIERTGSASNPFYQWVGIKPNIYMAKETLKDYTNYDSMDTDYNPELSVLDVEITAAIDVNDRPIHTNLLSLLKNRGSIRMLYVGGKFKYTRGRFEIIKTSGLLGMRITSSDNPQIKIGQDFKKELTKVPNIAYCAIDKYQTECLIIWSIEHNANEYTYKNTFKVLSDQLKTIDINVNYYINCHGSIFGHCFILDDDDPYYNHSPLPIILTDHQDTVSNDYSRHDLKKQTIASKMAGLAQKDIAQELGISQATVCRYLKEDSSLNIAFDDFWNLYDKKEDRDKCEKKWKSLTDADRVEIMEKVPPYIKATPDKQFRKNPITYLNNKAWRNEIVQRTYLKDPEYKPKEKMLAEYTENELWDELKRRGYSGTINKSLN